MKTALKFIGVSVLALAFAYGGHGAATVATPGGAPGSAFAPAMRSDAAFAFCITLDKAHVLGVVDAVLGKLDGMFGADNGQIAEIKALVESYKADPFKDAPQDVRSFLSESGLNEARLQWAVLSCESISDDNASKPKPKGISLAVAGSIDFEKFMKALLANCAKDSDSDVKITETAVAGVKAFRVVPQDAATVKKMKDEGWDNPCVASLDGRLVILAQTLDILAKQIRLFRGGEARYSALDGFSPARGSVVRLVLTDLGSSLKNKMKDVNFDAKLPNGNAIIFGMKRFVFDLQTTPAGALGLSMRDQTASEEHADILRTLFKTGLMMGRAKLAQSPDKPVGLIRLLETVKVGGANDAVEISVNTTISDVVAAFKPFMEAKVQNVMEAKAQNVWYEADAYFKGTNGHPKDWAKARELYIKAGKMFSTRASGGRLAQLGTFFDLKQGPFERDYAEAVKWYRKGAGLGNSWCMGKLSVLYREGRGVEKSVTNALHYAKMAADKGLGHYLAEYYERGIGVERDLTKAFELRRNEAEWLNPVWDRGGPAFKVGELYERGIGTPTNTVEAIRWYKKSKKQGNKKAEKRLQALGAVNHEEVGGKKDGNVDPNVLATYFDGPKVRPGVALEISVTAVGTEGSSKVQKFVDADGNITMELIGQVKCDGMTLVGLQKKLESAYKKYYLKPNVTVNFIFQPGQNMVSPYGTVTVLGEVARPGPVDVPSTMDLRLTRALQLAGGMTAIADKRSVQVTRCDKDGKQTKTKVDLVEIGEAGRPDKDMLLKAGDVVWVPMSWY